MSFFEMPFINLLPSQLNIDKMTGPRNAAKGPVTSKPSIKDATNQNSIALRTKENNPNVKIVRGSVITNKIGLITALTNPSMSATTKAMYKLATSTPGTTYATPKRANALINHRSMRYIYMYCNTYRP